MHAETETAALSLVSGALQQMIYFSANGVKDLSPRDPRLEQVALAARQMLAACNALLFKRDELHKALEALDG